LARKAEGMRPLGIPRHRWVDNIDMDLREIGWGGMDWIGLTHIRDQWMAFVNTVMKLRAPKTLGKFLSRCTTDGFTRRAQFHRVS
jgi:hypothetical protein